MKRGASGRTVSTRGMSIGDDEAVVIPTRRDAEDVNVFKVMG
jgi:hypothetical protein